MKRTLLAVLAFVVGSAFGQSPEPAKVRITTWNVEWFPNGFTYKKMGSVLTYDTTQTTSLTQKIGDMRP
jgi:hypothetical protein